MAPDTPSTDRRIVTDGGVSEDAVENLSESLADAAERIGTISDSMSDLEEAVSEASEAAEDLEG